MPNFLFIVQNNPIYRDQRVLLEMDSVKKNFSGNVFVVSPKYSRDAKEIKKNQNYKSYEFPCIEANSLISQLLEYLISSIFIFFIGNYLIFRYRIKVVHVANPPDFLVLLFSPAKLFGTKIIFDQHDLSLEMFRAKGFNEGFISEALHKSLNGLENLSYKLSDGIIFSNDKFREYFTAGFDESLSYGNTAVVRNGISIENRKHLSNFEIIQEKRFKAGKLDIIYIGIITRETGVDNLIELADLLNKKNVSFLFHIFGEGAYYSQFFEKVKSLNLSDCFKFYGFRSFDEIIKVAQYAHIGIIPWSVNSKNNLSTARKTYEYMLMAIPVFSLKLKEIMDTAADAGYYYDSFSDMADGIAELFCNNKEELFDKGKTGQERFLKYYSWEIQEKNLFNVYQKLLNKN